MHFSMPAGVDRPFVGGDVFAVLASVRIEPDVRLCCDDQRGSHSAWPATGAPDGR